MANRPWRILAPFLLALAGTSAASAQSLPFGDGACLTVPEGWRPAPPGWIGGGVEIMPRGEAPAPAGLRGRTIIRGSPALESITVTPAGTRTLGLLETLPASFQEDRRRPDEDLPGLKAYQIDHGEILYLSADRRIAMDCVPGTTGLLAGAGELPPRCIVDSRSLRPSLRLGLEIPYDQRREVVEKVEAAAALVRPLIRPCG